MEIENYDGRVIGAEVCGMKFIGVYAVFSGKERENKEGRDKWDKELKKIL